MAVRITDLTTASAINADDYVVIDGATDGTRKALASSVGGDSMIDFESSLSPSIDSRGVSGNYYSIIPAYASDLDVGNSIKISAYLLSSSVVYPLIVTYVSVTSSTFIIFVKSIFGNPQNTSSTTVSGTLHVVAPFEISSVTTSM